MADNKPAEAAAAPAPKPKAAGGGEVSSAVFMGVSFAMMAVMMAAGFALAFFVLPARISAQLDKTFKDALLQRQTAGPDLASDPTATPPDNATTPASTETPKPDGKTETAKPTEGAGEKPADGKTPAEGGKNEAAKPADAPKEFILNEIMVNVNGTQMGRLMKASLYFEASDATKKKLELNRAKIIDTVSSILRSKTMDELEKRDNTGVLKNEIVSRVNAIIPGGGVENVYFLDLVVQ